MHVRIVLNFYKDLIVGMNIKRRGRMLFGALVFALASTQVMAYKVVAGEKEQGFSLFYAKSTAPIISTDGLSSQQVVDQRCPGSKVTEINLADAPGQIVQWPMIQVVFIIPEGGCPKKQ